MKRLSPEKRNHLILVTAGTIAAIALVYFFLIGPQNTANAKLSDQIVSAKERLHKMQATIKNAKQTAQNVAVDKTKLQSEEKDVASGDLFAWTYATMRRFKAHYKLDIPTIGQPVESDVDLIPNFPFKQIKFSIIGSGYYHDIGKFVSDLENKFPHMRVLNLTIDAGGGQAASSQKLSFRLEVVALVKPPAPKAS